MLVALTGGALLIALLLLDPSEAGGPADPVRASSGDDGGRDTRLPDASQDPGTPGPVSVLPSGELRLAAQGVAPASLHGRVIDRAGTPRPLARVLLLVSEPGSFADALRPLDLSVSLDAEARFEIVGVPLDTPLAVEAQDDDSAPTRLPVRSLAAGERRPVGDLVLGPGTTLLGTVSDPDGSLLVGASIDVREGVRQEGDTLAQVFSDDFGRYEVPHLSARQYALRASHPGHASVETVQAFVLGPSGPSWTVDFVLPVADQVLFGQTVDGMGVPVPDVPMRLLLRQDRSSAHVVVETRSDAGGKFRLENQPAGRFEVSVSATHWYLAHTLVLEAGNEQHVVRLQAAQAVDGMLVSEGSLPSSFVVTVKPDGRTGARLLGNAPARRSFQSGGDGARFHFDGLRPGAYAFVVEAPGYAPTRSQDVILAPSQQGTEVLVPLLAGATLVGRVRPAAAGVKIELRPGDWDPSSPLEDAFPTAPLAGMGARTDESGGFQIEHVPEGHYVISARAAGMPASHLRDVAVLEGSQVDAGVLELRAGGSVAGTVTGPDGRPRAGAKVHLEGPDLHLATNSDGNGDFVLTDVPAGQYGVSASPSSLGEALLWQARDEVTVRAGERAQVKLVLSERPRQQR